MKTKMKLVIGYLYPDLMNIYGDTGNIIALQKRASWRGIEVKIKNISLKDKLKSGEIDLFFFGGGQDQAQELVAKDLLQNGKSKIIKAEVERGVPILSICGGYQLLGEYYLPENKPKIKGVGVFPAYTMAGKRRMIGNIVIRMLNSEFRVQNRNKNSTLFTHNSALTLVGFENHSGKTYLDDKSSALGKVISGFGNNGEGDRTAGCIYKNAIGCYLHGSLLPKNPKLADWLLKKALEVKYGKEVTLKPLDDNLENSVHQELVKKFS